MWPERRWQWDIWDSRSKERQKDSSQFPDCQPARRRRDWDCIPSVQGIYGWNGASICHLQPERGIWESRHYLSQYLSPHHYCLSELFPEIREWRPEDFQFPSIWGWCGKGWRIISYGRISVDHYSWSSRDKCEIWDTDAVCLWHSEPFIDWVARESRSHLQSNPNGRSQEGSEIWWVDRRGDWRDEWPVCNGNQSGKT